MVRVALLGFGTVGSAVARRLAATSPASRNIVISHVFDRRPEVKRRTLQAPHPIVWTDRFADILESDADIVVETIGGIEPAADFIRSALEAGKSVVTANKQVIARHGAALWPLAARQGRQLRFEAAVGGAMPIVRAIGEGLAGDRITGIRAILNGTTNAVLSAMESGCSQAEAIADARSKGYAESDARADLDGDDARAKLAILCALAFGVHVTPDEIPARSASSVGPADVAAARQRNGAIRQIAHAAWDRGRRELAAWVAPAFVAGDSIFARTVGAHNAALITAEYSGETGIWGAGAGGDATAVAVISDLLAIARDRAAVVPAPHLSSDFRFRISDFELREFALEAV